MKVFKADKPQPENFNELVSEIRDLINVERLPHPVKVEFYEQDADNFINNKVTVVVSSLAVTKYDGLTR